MKTKREQKMTDAFLALNQQTRYSGETNDCTVKLTALVLGVPYAEAHALCERYGRKARKAMMWYDMVIMLNDCGVNLVELSPRSFIDRYPGVHTQLKNVTTHHPARFNRVWADGEQYIFLTMTHVAFVDNGTLHDWTVTRSKQVKWIFRVEKRKED